MRKVPIILEVRAEIELEQGVDLQEVIDDLDYEIVSSTDGAEVLDTEIIDWYKER
jgi:hypothetical protein